ncbi:MAG: hypothetical protein M3021_11095 [Actinomycetota bacterium]|nr:hypothetical protein [Actinomycetota bacterium]
MPYAGSLTLLDVTGKTDTLVIACRRCDRAGGYPVATLIERHGRSFPIPTLLHTLSRGLCRRAENTARRHRRFACPAY